MKMDDFIFLFVDFIFYIFEVIWFELGDVIVIGLVEGVGILW